MIIRLALTFVAIAWVAVHPTYYTGGQRAPTLLQGASAPSVLTFAAALAARRIPTGIVVSARTVGRHRADVPGRQGDATLPDAIARFNQIHPGYKAALADGVVLIEEQPVPDPIAALLNRTHAARRYEAVPAMAFLFEIGDRLANAPDRARGVAGTGPPVGDCPLTAPIGLAERPHTTRELLDALTRQSNGLLWLLIHDLDAKQDRLQLGYMCPNGVFYRFTVRGW